MIMQFNLVAMERCLLFTGSTFVGGFANPCGELWHRTRAPWVLQKAM